MKKWFFLGIFLGVIGVAVTGASWHKGRAPKEVRQLMAAKDLAKFVKDFYIHVCSQPEATLVATAIAIKELGKDGKIDAPKHLHRLLAKTKLPRLRNFIRFLIVDSYKERKAKEEMLEELISLAEENLKWLQEKQVSTPAVKERKQEKKTKKSPKQK